MLDGVSIIRSEKVKDELVLDGNDIELVSRSAALINQVSSIPCHFQFLPLAIHMHREFYTYFFLFILGYRNAMSRTKISGSSLMVFMSAKRVPLSKPSEEGEVLFNHDSFFLYIYISFVDKFTRARF